MLTTFQVVSLGGQIGAGLFISSGLMLRNGGPGNLLLAFLVVCSCVWAILQTVSEMTISFPVSGNYVDYADRFVDPALSFCAGFSMWLGWTAIIAAEAVFFATVVSYWAGDTVHPAVWCKFFYVLPHFNRSLTPHRHHFPGFDDCHILCSSHHICLVRVFHSYTQGHRALYVPCHWAMPRSWCWAQWSGS